MSARALRHALTCPTRRRWRRSHYGQPFWRDDKTAQFLDIAQYGCPRCGRGAAEQRDAAAIVRALRAGDR